MGLLKNGWCLCGQLCGSSRCPGKGASVVSNRGAIVRIGSSGTGILIHRALVLTTHGTLPSFVAAEGSNILVTATNSIDSQPCSRRLAPERFFITNSVLDLTVVACDPIDTDIVQPLCLQNSVVASLDFGRVVYLLGYQSTEELFQELVTGEGRITVGTDTLIKVSTDGMTWCPGSAGFDSYGNLAFMICDPMKLVADSSQKKKVSAATFWKKDVLKQFGIPIPVIRHWLSQHWEGNIDELDRSKIPARLKSCGSSTSYRSFHKEIERSFSSSPNSDKDLDDEVSSAFAKPGNEVLDSDSGCDREIQPCSVSIAVPLNSTKVSGTLKDEEDILYESCVRKQENYFKKANSFPMGSNRAPIKQHSLSMEQIVEDEVQDQTPQKSRSLQKKNSCLRQLMSEDTSAFHSTEPHKEKLQLLDIKFPPMPDKTKQCNGIISPVNISRLNSETDTAVSHSEEKKQSDFIEEKKQKSSPFQAIPSVRVENSNVEYVNKINGSYSTAEYDLLDSPEYGSAISWINQQELAPSHRNSKYNEADDNQHLVSGNFDDKTSDDLVVVNESQLTALEAEDPPSDCSSVGDSGVPIEHFNTIVKINAQVSMESDVETMYSAETRESRNYSPREIDDRRNYSQGRQNQCSTNISRQNQSPSSSSRGEQGKNSKGKKCSPSKQKSTPQGRRNQVHPSCNKKITMQVPSYKSAEYLGPTVSSIMKKRNLKATSNNKPNIVQETPRWIF